MPGGTLDLNPFAGNRWPPHAGFIDLGTTILVFALFALGFNLLFGHTGELSFGHAMFFALGAYATALYTKGFDVTRSARASRTSRREQPLVALALALGVSRCSGRGCWRAHRAALERHLLLDDHARVRASRSSS